MLHKTLRLLCISAAIELKTTLSLAPAELDSIVEIISTSFATIWLIHTFPVKAVITSALAAA